jgi:hypothetical protein
VVDGRDDDPVWAIASSPITGFRDDQDGALAEYQTYVKILYTNNELFFYFKFDEPSVDNLTSAASSRDGMVWLDDSGEIFLDIGRTGTTWYQFIFNCGHPAGTNPPTLYDSRNGSPTTYNAQSLQAAIFIGSDFWSGEVKVSFADLGTTTPGENTIWSGDVCRNRIQDGISSSWSGTRGDWPDLGNFRDISFGAPVGVDREKTWGKIKQMFAE